MPEPDDDDTGAGAPALGRAPKRIFTPATWFTAFADVLVSGPVLLAALVRPRTSAALREKVMLGVTSVTDCRYCQWGHSHWAMAQGVPLEEINQILGLQGEPLKAMDPAEATAILFAQHYAENLDRFDPADQGVAEAECQRVAISWRHILAVTDPGTPKSDLGRA